MKKIIIVLIIILICFISFLTFYKYSKPDKKENYFIKTFLETKKYNMNFNEKLDKETYKEYIIEENLKEIDYTFLDEKNSITGKVYIGKDDCLYITDINSNINYKLSTVKFKTMYTKDIEYENAIYIYLISTNNKLYYYSLETNDIKKGLLGEIVFNDKVFNFTNLEFIGDKFDPCNTLFVLAFDGNIYDVASGLRYDSKVKSLYTNLYVFDDNTMTNSYGKMIEDKNGNNYKIKYIFNTYENNKFIDDNKIIIVTEDNKFIYFDDNMENVYEFSKKVSNVDFDVYYPYVEGNLKVTFEDGYNVSFKASCNQYFCVNDFAE